jgi:hypothetical protein
LDALSVVFVSPEELKVETPVGLTGEQDVTVTNPDNQFDTKAIAFIFETEAPFTPTESAPFGTNPPINVFNPAVGGRGEIPFHLASSQKVRIEIRDRFGVLIRKIFDDQLGAGPQIEFWDGRNDDRDIVAEGYYYAIVHADGRNKKIKLVIKK